MSTPQIERYAAARKRDRGTRRKSTGRVARTIVDRVRGRESSRAPSKTRCHAHDPLHRAVPGKPHHDAASLDRHRPIRRRLVDHHRDKGRRDPALTVTAGESTLAGARRRHRLRLHVLMPWRAATATDRSHPAHGSPIRSVRCSALDQRRCAARGRETRAHRRHRPPQPHRRRPLYDPKSVIAINPPRLVAMADSQTENRIPQKYAPRRLTALPLHPQASRERRTRIYPQFATHERTHDTPRWRLHMARRSRALRVPTSARDGQSPARSCARGAWRPVPDLRAGGRPSRPARLLLVRRLLENGAEQFES